MIEYATYHTEQDKKEGDKKDEDKDTTFDTEFVKVDQATSSSSSWCVSRTPITPDFFSPTAPFVASEKTQNSH